MDPHIAYYQATMDCVRAEVEIKIETMRMRAALMGVTMPAQRLADAWTMVAGSAPKHAAECVGCGAPLQRLATACAYCRRPHG